MKKVFYCDDCADERRWPYQINRVRGNCNFCGQDVMGSLTPESVLPAKVKIEGQLSFRLETNMRDKYWPHRCTLLGCPKPDLRPHHHHYYRGHLDLLVCECPQIDQPGTRPKEE